MTILVVFVAMFKLQELCISLTSELDHKLRGPRGRGRGFVTFFLYIPSITKLGGGGDYIGITVSICLSMFPCVRPSMCLDFFQAILSEQLNLL